MQRCPICQNETNDREKTCPGCGYRFPVTPRRARIPRGSLMDYPHITDSNTGKEMIFL